MGIAGVEPRQLAFAISFGYLSFHIYISREFELANKNGKYLPWARQYISRDK
jgi:hypothetical protein